MQTKHITVLTVCCVVENIKLYIKSSTVLDIHLIFRHTILSSTKSSDIIRNKSKLCITYNADVVTCAAVGCKSNISINEFNIMEFYSDRLTLE